MRTGLRPSAALLGVLWSAAAAGAGTTSTVLQNDAFAGGASGCRTGIDDQQSLAARLSAPPGGAPYRLEALLVLGCGGGEDAYAITLYADTGGSSPVPGAVLYQSSSPFLLSGSNGLAEIDLSGERLDVSDATVRVEINNVGVGTPIGFGLDADGIVAQRNFLRDPLGWSFAEDLGLAGDFVLRLRVVPAPEPAQPLLLAAACAVLALRRLGRLSRGRRASASEALCTSKGLRGTIEEAPSPRHGRSSPCSA